MFITLTIFANWVIYMSQTWPKQTEPIVRFGVYVQDYALLPVFIIYTLEALIKMITFGVFTNGTVKTKQKGVSKVVEKTPPAYFQDSFNRFDFLVIVCYWISIALTCSGIKGYLAFKALSSLRPLRLLSLTRGLAVCRRRSKCDSPE